MRRVKRGVKLAIAYTLYYLGVLRLWKAIVLRRRAVVLMYHRVLSAEEQRRSGSHPGIVVTRETFAQHVDIIRRHFHPMSLTQFADRLERGVPFESSSCLVTFDDGWQDNFVHALPVLERQGVPAVVFLPINFIGARRLFWREALTHLIVEIVRRRDAEPALLAGAQPLLRSAGLTAALQAPPDDTHTFVAEVIAAQGQLKAAEAEPLVAALASVLGTRVEDLDTPDTFIDWPQARAMAARGITFGGHGTEHRLLTDISITEAESEIRASRVAIAPIDGNVPTFSYPNGNSSPEIADRVKRAGYRLAFTTRPGFVACSDDKLSLKRLNIHESATDSAPLFLARVVGLL